MLHWATKRILVTRDVLWLKRMYFDKKIGEISKDKPMMVDLMEDDEDEVRDHSNVFENATEESEENSTNSNIENNETLIQDATEENSKEEAKEEEENLPIGNKEDKFRALDMSKLEHQARRSVSGTKGASATARPAMNPEEANGNSLSPGTEKNYKSEDGTGG